MVQFRRKELPESEDTLEPLSKFYEYGLQLLLKLLDLKNSPTDVTADADRNVHL